jgi:hypothetical protein
MWYGRSVEEVPPEVLELQEAQARAQAQAEYEAQYWEAAEQQRYDPRYDQILTNNTVMQAMDGVYQLQGDDGLHSGREAYTVKSWSQDFESQAWFKESMLNHERSTDAHGRSYAQGGGIAATSLRSPASIDRDLRAAPLSSAIGSSVASSVPQLRMSGLGASIGNTRSGSAVQATSLSPRRAATLWSASDGDITSRTTMGQVLGAPPPTYGSYQASPPQTHRAPRNSASPLMGVPASPLMGSSTLGSASSASAVMRPRSPVTAHRVPQGRLSLTGSSVAQGLTTRTSMTGLQLSSSSRGTFSGSTPSSLTARVSSGGSQQLLAGTAVRR